VVEKDPNLGHWSWFAMQEMNKNYKHLRPGQVIERGGVKPKSHYIKPAHIPTVARSTSHPPVAINTKEPGGGLYIKPKHIATHIPPPTRADTYIKLYAPKTNVALSAPRTAIQLAAPKTNASLASTKTSIQLAALRTNVQLAAPKTQAQLVSQHAHGQLVAKQTSVQLAAPQTQASLRADPMDADYGRGDDGDSFSHPDAYEHNVYGLARHTSSGYSGASASLRGKLIRRGRGR
jgi:hypothetical protein